MANKRAMVPNTPLAGTKPLIPTREMAYELAADKRLPTTRAATKCLSQRHLFEQRVEFDTLILPVQAFLRVAALLLAAVYFRQHYKRENFPEMGTFTKGRLRQRRQTWPTRT